MLQLDDSRKNSEYNEDLQEKVNEISQKSNKNEELNFTKAQKNIKRRNEVRLGPEIIKKSEKDGSHVSL